MTQASTGAPSVDPIDRLPPPWGDEAALSQDLRQALQARLHWPTVRQRCEPWVLAVRRKPPPFWALESLLQEFPLSTTEGLALMRLAEAMLRVPDLDTARLLLSDQLAQADFSDLPRKGQDSAHPLWSRASARVLELAQRILPPPEPGAGPSNWAQRMGSSQLVAAVVRALHLLSGQFVLGDSIEAALQKAQPQWQADDREGLTTRFSVDMLGEGARNWDDAERYLSAYRAALVPLSQAPSAGAPPLPFPQRQGLSIKLSALHPRLEASQHDRVVSELLPRLEELLAQAAAGGVMLTFDAEESDRLELQLDLLHRLLERAGPLCEGLGLAVQAYQLRARPLIEQLIALAMKHRRRLCVRLVKGAYWDTEIKRAQELGLPAYPVFTQKAHTDLSYLACADLLLAHAAHVYPQFATHNASTIAAVQALAQQHHVGPDQYEWQRLHGMGEGIYREMRSPGSAALRIYAPVGPHRDLLAYLVRRLLENGANASFVNQLGDERVGLDELLRSPLEPVPASLSQTLPLPVNLYAPERVNSPGRDLSVQTHRQALQMALATRREAGQATAPPVPLDADQARALMRQLHGAWPDWEATLLNQRCAVLESAADHLASELDHWAADLVIEARKTLDDAVAEVRETIDLARYYAWQARQTLAPQPLPGPTGEHNLWRWRSRGVFVCIAPWNFPLAIFGGQVMAALVCGNTVAAKPADATPRIAARFIELLHDCGVPRTALAWAGGPGKVVGTALVSSPHCAGLAFTGSIATAKELQRLRVESGGPMVPLIMETGGLNAMVVDSTALPEQVVDSVIHSAFSSAGQRCSSLRLLCLQEDTADVIEHMLAGAMATLRPGHAADWHNDLGPIIHQQAFERLQSHLAELDAACARPGGVRLIARAPAPHPAIEQLLTPAAYALPRVQDLNEEHFGPILHVVRWGKGCAAPDLDTLIDQINASGYGLTLGVQTRIDARAQHIAWRCQVGNVYVNRNMTGAVVGAQPFGGRGWSGTGPKAGGPHYLQRFCTEQVVSTDTTAAGGNAALLASRLTG